LKSPRQSKAEAEFAVQVLPLVSGVQLPYPATAHTRSKIPAGYGVQEQCLPFTAATSLGCVVTAPIAFGLCPPNDVPADARPFRSPLDRLGSGDARDPRVFYVKDDVTCSFVGNAFTFDAIGLPEATGRAAATLVEPGISFFDRRDQNDLFKLHLPYIFQTPHEIDSLFLPAINRELAGLSVLAGLVETDWYAHPVNLVIRKPPSGMSLRVHAGDPVAQVVFVPRQNRRPSISVLPHHARAARDLRRALGDCYRCHEQDRSAYKRLARRQSAAVPDKA